MPNPPDSTAAATLLTSRSSRTRPRLVRGMDSALGACVVDEMVEALMEVVITTLYQADGRGVENPEEIGFEVSTSLIFEVRARVQDTISAVLKHCSSPHLQMEVLRMSAKINFLRARPTATPGFDSLLNM